MKTAPKLAQCEDEQINGIKIFRDLNETDRAKRKALVDEMKEKNKELEQQNVTDNKWIIRGEKVVKIKINPNRARPITASGENF